MLARFVRSCSWLVRGIAVALWPLLATAVPASADTGRAPACASGAVAGIDELFTTGRNFNREKIGQAYPAFAAASYDVYVDSRDARTPRFVLADDDPVLRGVPRGRTGWTFAERYDDNRNSGLVYDVYTRSDPDKLVVMVAYRGTDGFFNVDLLSNASWFTQWFNRYDQYRLARERFRTVQELARRLSRGRPVAYVTTGHSLGGGLAQHIAHFYPCVSAVVFNASFVTNESFYPSSRPTIVQIFEDNDVFSFFSSRVDNTGPVLRYRMNAAERDARQHSMESLAAGLMRTTLACRSRSNCQMRGSIDLAQTLYCRRYRALRNMPADVCPSLSMATSR